MKNTFLFVFGAGVLSFVLPLTVFSAVMGSGSYQIQLDSVNVGGLDSQSSNYASEDTMGEVGSGESASASYKVNGGYQQMDDSSISITSPVDVTMDAVSGFSGGISNGSTTWRVTTDNSTGYSLSMRASTNPAMKGVLGGSFIPDYITATADPDFAFSVDVAASTFAYSPEGVDIVARYQDDGVSCNTGSGATDDACWDGLTTSDVEVASSPLANMPLGTNTKIKYRVGIGADRFQDSGVYNATIIVTATTL